MTSTHDVLLTAMRLHQSGDLPAAEREYREILRREPGHVDALHLLGVLSHQSGDHEGAIDLIGRALASRCDVAAFHGNLGIALKAAGKLNQAIESYRRALRIDPEYAEAHCNLGNGYRSQGRFDEALACYQQALRIKPDYADALSNMGAAMRHLGRLDEAVSYCRQALGLRPRFAGALVNLGNSLRERGELEQAVAALQEARRLKPDDPDVHGNLGNALQEQGLLDDAITCYRRALDLNPSFPQAHCNLGAALRNSGRPDEAATCYQKALDLDPNFATAHWNLALYLLSDGEFDQGWEEYEWRWKLEGLASRDFQTPVWQGESLAGQTILIHAEQGMGDTIQFVRYLPLVKERGGTVILECQPVLAGLLRDVAGADQVIVAGSELPPFDVRAPLLSLPRVMQTRLATIPAEIPYLWADPTLVESWRSRLARFAGRRIGICWQGSPTWNRDRYRSIPLACFGSLARIPGVTLISLQKRHGLEQLDSLAGAFPVTDFRDELDETTGPFLDTAAIMMNLDLVVTCDTAIAHLAGALGVPVWLAEEFVGEWRWLRNRDDSPWYPTMRVFRQAAPGDWDGVFRRVAAAMSANATRD